MLRTIADFHTTLNHAREPDKGLASRKPLFRLLSARAWPPNSTIATTVFIAGTETHRTVREGPDEPLPQRLEPLVFHSLLYCFPIAGRGGIEPSGHVLRCLVKSSDQILSGHSLDPVLHLFSSGILTRKPLRDLRGEGFGEDWDVDAYLEITDLFYRRDFSRLWETILLLVQGRLFDECCQTSES